MVLLIRYYHLSVENNSEGIPSLVYLDLAKNNIY